MFELLQPAAMAFISTVERIPTDGYYNDIRHGGKEHLPLSNKQAVRIPFISALRKKDIEVHITKQ